MPSCVENLQSLLVLLSANGTLLLQGVLQIVVQITTATVGQVLATDYHDLLPVVHAADAKHFIWDTGFLMSYSGLSCLSLDHGLGLVNSRRRILSIRGLICLCFVLA